MDPVSLAVGGALVWLYMRDRNTQEELAQIHEWTQMATPILALMSQIQMPGKEMPRGDGQYL